MTDKPRPNLLWSMLTMKCPRCRRGPMFKDPNSYRKLKLSHIFDMHDNCPVCHQKYDMETGFWYGTGYVSYGLAVLFSAVTFIAWLVLIGISADDSRIFWWLGINTVLLIAVQPWLMRISRVMYIYIFVRYDKNYETTEPKSFD